MAYCCCKKRNSARRQYPVSSPLPAPMMNPPAHMVVKYEIPRPMVEILLTDEPSHQATVPPTELINAPTNPFMKFEIPRPTAEIP